MVLIRTCRTLSAADLGADVLVLSTLAPGTTLVHYDGSASYYGPKLCQHSALPWLRPSQSLIYAFSLAAYFTPSP